MSGISPTQSDRPAVGALAVALQDPLEEALANPQETTRERFVEILGTSDFYDRVFNDGQRICHRLAYDHVPIEWLQDTFRAFDSFKENLRKYINDAIPIRPLAEIVFSFADCDYKRMALTALDFKQFLPSTIAASSNQSVKQLLLANEEEKYRINKRRCLYRIPRNIEFRAQQQNIP